MLDNNKIESLRQAIGAAESSLKMAKQLLGDLESGGAGRAASAPMSKKEPEGITGTFDGEQMVTDGGEKYPVPANYASKSLLVVGDRLKLVEEAGQKRFKQIEHVKRHRTDGILAKKDGKWKAVTPEGSYKVLHEAVVHFGGDVGDEVTLHLPAANLSSSFGAIESVAKKAKEESSIEQQEEPKPEAKEAKVEKLIEKKPAIKKEPAKKVFQETPEKKEPEKPATSTETKRQEKVEPEKVINPAKVASSEEDELT